ncbi:hypothetical protein [Dermatophilus congolensis]|uniref:hypothetical protein n=1 Tax=Dermatophilus congolensis TaxID=1863 RepID=UPI001AAF9EB7|nr:hypothetical protein [Dermatophilus congolensis]MBO3142606.1 hypothetical protein [Dermatophilus congolensis]MBO3151595.1 hypothetical protein [Dermatophilus congolensis]MBO3161403.1 hypothetical protein [Dermatophilus congolensis]MBO3162880.1 hypothetical protein [Dermatophilus congolensis]MBO3176433.1 hypothetical protein [Dermatophilus congolensis]
MPHTPVKTAPNTAETTLTHLLQKAGHTNPAWTWGESVNVACTPSPETEVRSATSMTDPDVARTVIEEHAASRGIPPNRHAASLVFQRYCHRWCAITSWAWALTGCVLDVSAERCATTFDNGSPVAIWIDHLQGAETDSTTLVDVVFEQHLMPIAYTFRDVARFSIANARGNAAASLAAGFRFASTTLPAEKVLDLAESVFTHPALQRSGTFRVVNDSLNSRVFFDRNTCCHWDTVPDGQLCSWCSKRTHEDRTAQFTEALAAQ